jgi:hypothetical protein
VPEAKNTSATGNIGPAVSGSNDAERCPIYLGLNIRGVKVGPARVAAARRGLRHKAHQQYRR